MTRAQDILAEICAHPEQDEMRLEFARAIRSHDAQWSQYIVDALTRSEDAFASYPYDLEVPNAARRAVSGRLHSLGVRDYRWFRGFVEEIVIDVVDFVRHGEEIMTAAPIIHVAFRASRTYPAKRWSNIVPALRGCRALARVRKLSFRMDAVLDLAALARLFELADLDKLIALGRYRDEYPESTCQQHDIDEDAEQGMWETLLESPVFRRLTEWGLRTNDVERPTYTPFSSRLITHRQLGDRKWQDLYSHDGHQTWFEPMDAESRALEEWYGYLPALHAGNWDATLLEILRGEKPLFPAGARPVPAMYEVPKIVVRNGSGY